MFVSFFRGDGNPIWAVHFEIYRPGRIFTAAWPVGRHFQPALFLLASSITTSASDQGIPEVPGTDIGTESG